MFLILLACAGADPGALSPEGSAPIPSEPIPSEPIPAPAPATEDPAEPLGTGSTVRQRFPPPEGFERVDGGAYGDWLGQLQLRPEGTPVRTHDGQVVGHHAQVIELPLVPGDLQQCADSAIRLRAEWLREQGAEISFHATSGDPMPWARWVAGERPFAVGNKLVWRPGRSGGWEDYLAKVFTWAGTRSLAYDSDAVDEPLPGDIVVAPGSPGHAVVLLDVARRGDEVLLLIGEGYMPAQDFHVELGPRAGWWPWTTEGLSLDHWHLPAGGLRRFTPASTGAG